MVHCMLTLAAPRTPPPPPLQSIADVRSRLEQDVYYSSGVFDPAKVRIFPFLKASLGDSPAAAAASASGNADQTTTTTTTTTTKTTITPSLSKLREEEMSRWAEKAAKSLQWLREGGGKQGLA